MTEDGQRLFGGVLPLDDVGSGDIELAGRLAELIDRLRAAVDVMAEPMTVEAWAAALATAADSLTAAGPLDAWQRAELQRLLDDIVAEAGVSGAAATPLALAEVRALLADRLGGRPTRTNFRTGHLTICTLVPMRSVPHRVVCLLGLDDGEFPRKAVRDGDDLVLRDPHVGDRDSRMEDRQMLLDALMAATDRLIVTYTGKDERTNTPRPPAVPVGELLDAIEERCGERLVVQHPLQPFDPRNFTAGALVPDRTWGFDRVTLQGAQAIEAPRAAPASFLPAPLPGRDDGVVELDQLVAFAERPVSAFVRQRLRMSLWEEDDELAEALSVELTALERSGFGARLLAARLGGAELDACLAAERARGLLPPGHLGEAVLRQLAPEVEAIATAALACARGDGETVDVRAAQLRGTVAGVHGDTLREVRYARISARHRIATWVRWLALTVAYPERGFRAVLIGRAPASADEPVRTVRYAAIDPDEAREHLEALLDLHRRGLREPLPLATGPAAAYVERGEEAARREWDSRFNFDGEDKRPEHRMAFDGVRSFDELLRFAAAAGRGLARGGADALRPARAAAVERRGGVRVVSAFEVTGPLPTGVNVLEASAGTGKTYTIAALAARYVAEGTPLDQLLLVTFTRMATGELRDRVRERLVGTERGLARALAGETPGDAVVELLARGDARRGGGAPRAPRRRARRLRQRDDRDDPRLLPGGAGRARRGRRRRAGRHLRRGHLRPRRGGGRRPLRAPLPLGGARGLRARGGAADRPRRGRQPVRADRAARRARRHGGGDAAQSGPGRTRRARAPQAAAVGHDLRRPPHPPEGDPRGAGRRRRGEAAARALPRRARRRVPGHRPGAVGHRRARVRRPSPRSSSSATRSRRSTPSAAPTSTRT